jgi:hypothetical protein
MIWEEPHTGIVGSQAFAPPLFIKVGSPATGDAN